MLGRLGKLTLRQELEFFPVIDGLRDERLCATFEQNPPEQVDASNVDRKKT